MRKSYIWSLALASVAVSGAVAASSLAPAFTRAEGDDEVNVTEVNYLLDPEDGAIVNDLHTISISFPDLKTVEVNERMELNAIVLTNTTTGEEYYCDSPVRDTRSPQGPAFTLTFLGTAETENGSESVDAPITEPGTYELNILKGTFIYGEEVVNADETVTLENQAPVQGIKASYTVQAAEPQVVYSLDPADGAIVNDLQTITVTFPNNKNVIVNDRMELNAIVLSNIETGEEYYCDAPVQNTRVDGGSQFILNFLTSVESVDGVEEVLAPINAVGNYELTILKGTFLTADEVDNGESVTYENQQAVEAINAKYSIVEPQVQIVYELDPQNGEVVTDLQTINIIFPVNKNVQVNEKLVGGAIVLRNVETEEEYYCDYPEQNTFAPVPNGMAFQLNFLTIVETEEGFDSQLLPINEPGTYELSIMKGAFQYGDEVEDPEGNISLDNILPVLAIKATYNVVADLPKIAYELDPADGAYVDNLQTINITFPDNKPVVVNERFAHNSAVLTNVETGAEYYCDYPEMNTRAPQGGSAYQLNFLTTMDTEDGVDSQFLPIVEPGTYKLTIVKGAFLYVEEEMDENGDVISTTILTPVQDIEATYVISTTGVNAVAGSANEFSVYGVNGVQIMKAADSNSVDALPAGLYIINGKKVIKK